jgi:hypothetical protein
MIIYGIWNCEGPFEQPKLAQTDKVLHKWFTAMHSEGKPVTGLMIIEKAKFIMMK